MCSDGRVDTGRYPFAAVGGLGATVAEANLYRPEYCATLRYPLRPFRGKLKGAYLPSPRNATFLCLHGLSLGEHSRNEVSHSPLLLFPPAFHSSTFIGGLSFLFAGMRICPLCKPRRVALRRLLD